MKTDLSKFDNSWYKPGPKIKIVLWYIVNVLIIRPKWNVFSGIKVKILRSFGAKIGQGVIIKPGVNIKYPWKLKVGKHCWIGENVWIDNLDLVILEDHVCISQGAFLECGNHNYQKPTFDLIIAPITLKEGSWVGAQSIVAPGVTLHSHAILSLGSTANQDLEAYHIYQGNPAAKVKKRNLKQEF